MTADELRAIVARKDEDDRRHAAWESGRTAHNQLLLDRDALVGLLQQVAACFLDGDGFYLDGNCQFCGVDIGNTQSGTLHRTGCPAPVLKVLRPVEGPPR